MLMIEHHADIGFISLGEGSPYSLKGLDLDLLIPFTAADTRSVRPQGWLRNAVIEKYRKIAAPGWFKQTAILWHSLRLEELSKKPDGTPTGKEAAFKEAFEKAYKLDGGFKDFMDHAVTIGFYTFYQLSPESLVNFYALLYQINKTTGLIYFDLASHKKAAEMEAFLSKLPIQTILTGKNKADNRAMTSEQINEAVSELLLVGLEYEKIMEIINAPDQEKERLIISLPVFSGGYRFSHQTETLEDVIYFINGHVSRKGKINGLSDIKMAMPDLRRIADEMKRRFLDAVTIIKEAGVSFKDMRMIAENGKYWEKGAFFTIKDLPQMQIVAVMKAIDLYHGNKLGTLEKELRSFSDNRMGIGVILFLFEITYLLEREDVVKRLAQRVNEDAQKLKGKGLSDKKLTDLVNYLKIRWYRGDTFSFDQGFNLSKGASWELELIICWYNGVVWTHGEKLGYIDPRIMQKVYKTIPYFQAVAAKMKKNEMMTAELSEASQTTVGRSENSAMKGGIDLTTADQGMTVTRDAQGGVKVNLDPAMIARIRRQGIQSAIPFILDIHRIPLADFGFLLGLKKVA